MFFPIRKLSFVFVLGILLSSWNGHAEMHAGEPTDKEKDRTGKSKPDWSDFSVLKPVIDNNEDDILEMIDSPKAGTATILVTANATPIQVYAFSRRFFKRLMKDCDVSPDENPDYQNLRKELRSFEADGLSTYRFTSSRYTVLQPRIDQFAVILEYEKFYIIDWIPKMVGHRGSRVGLFDVRNSNRRVEKPQDDTEG